MSQLCLATRWQLVATGDTTVAVAERPALGTSARVAVWPPENLHAALDATDRVVGALDRQASRFREDSEISWLHRRGGGLFMLSDGLAEAISVALAAARWTGGLVDPTVGEALISLGYDRDFASIHADGGAGGGPAPAPSPVPGWRAVRLDGPMMNLPAGVRLDLGATAKGLGSDRAARAAMAANNHTGGVLVSLGGDLAVDGQPPRGGWPVLVADEPDPGASARTQSVRLVSGAVATSSITCRQWRRGGRVMHHIVDPRTGLPADAPWQTVSVAAPTCADANAAATAAIVAGDRAEEWLVRARVPARLVSRHGQVRYLGEWPDADGGRISIRARSHVYARGGPDRGIGPFGPDREPREDRNLGIAPPEAADGRNLTQGTRGATAMTTAARTMTDQAKRRPGHALRVWARRGGGGG